MAHKFELWGGDQRFGMQHMLKAMWMYWGWTNGFIQHRGESIVPLADCLEKLSIDQAIAIIDKRFKEHPEWWSRPLGDEILGALTDSGQPCAGLSPIP